MLVSMGALVVLAAAGEELLLLDRDWGYRGIWYANQRVDAEYVYKYSGGLGSYCAKHIPHCVYCPEADKTFFVYGGTRPAERRLLAMISYYDHATDRVPRPVILLDKQTADAHDNPVLSVDADGHLWVFVSSHGTARPSYILRSTAPYAIDDFELVLETNFSYPQPWHIQDEGFLFLHTHYEPGRNLCFRTSPGGREWTERTNIAQIHHGHYQISWPQGSRVGTAFNYHPHAFQGDPERAGLNWRTNLYYMETRDMGATWTNVQGVPLETPLTEPANAALAIPYEKQGLLCYLKDLKYDSDGNPVILHLTARSWEPGLEGGPRHWRVARWNGSEWENHIVTTSDNNYDTGSLAIFPDGTWRVIGPTETGPQPFNPGGELAVWTTSAGQGATWNKERQLTQGSLFNHTYCRRPLNAAPGFAAFWADGHGRQPSESRLYFYDAERRRVRRLPFFMSEDYARPEVVE